MVNVESKITEEEINHHPRVFTESAIKPKRTAENLSQPYSDSDFAFVVHRPGVYRLFKWLKTQFLAQGAGVHFICPAVLPFPIETNGMQTEKEIGKLDYLFVTDLTDFPLEIITLAKQNNPHVKIIFIEQTENSALRSISTMLANKINPQLILTVTQEAAQKVQVQLPADFSALVKAIGNPEIYGSSLDPKKIRRKVREKLTIENSTKLITYIGRPDGANFDTEIIDPKKPNDSLALQSALLALIDIAKQQPEQLFKLIYLPHPADPLSASLWAKILQSSNGHLPSNLQLSYDPRRSDHDCNNHGQQRENILQIDTNHLALASDLVLTIRSTVGQTMALLGALRDPQTPIPLTLHLLLDKFMDNIETSAKPDQLLILRLGAAPFAQNDRDLGTLIRRALFDQEFITKFRQQQAQHLPNEFFHQQTAETIGRYL